MPHPFEVDNAGDALERGGILVSRLAGRTRLYTFNPRFPFLDEVKALLERAMAFYPDEERPAKLVSAAVAMLSDALP